MDDARWNTFLHFVDQCGGGHTGCCPNVIGKMIKLLPGCLDEKVNNKALVVGAGVGNGERKELEARGYVVTQVDLIPQNEAIIRGDMHDLPFQTGFFDVVIYNQVFEHSICPLMALFESNRVLKIGGIAAFAWPDVIERWVKDPQHYSVFNRLQMESLLNRLSFVVSHYEKVSEDGSKAEEQQMQVLLACKINEPFRMVHGPA